MRPVLEVDTDLRRDRNGVERVQINGAAQISSITADTRGDQSKVQVGFTANIRGTPGTVSYKPSYLDDIETHVDNMFSTGAVITGSWVTLESVAEVPTVKVMITQVIMASPAAQELKQQWTVCWERDTVSLFSTCWPKAPNAVDIPC